ncbi:unnamed protein product [Polarella glacialis]|uniref:Uncharacterized protein n=1 Tax=Polarella glacialis TaxID=89957 RepID=A0A813LJA5_POLGL|nr:unnamed protein product [Polarella glacialis]
MVQILTVDGRVSQRLQQELSTAEADKAALLQELEKAKQAASELESAKGEVSQRLQQELSTAEAEKAALLQELETSKQAASELESAKGEVSQRLQQELSAAEAEKAALLQELETSKQAASELESAKGEAWKHLDNPGFSKFSYGSFQLASKTGLFRMDPLNPWIPEALIGITRDSVTESALPAGKVSSLRIAAGAYVIYNRPQLKVV